MQLRIWALSKSINTLYFKPKLNNFPTSTDTHNVSVNYFQSNLDSGRVSRKQSNNRLTAHLLSFGFVLGLGGPFSLHFKVLWVHSCNITATLIEVIVLSDRESKSITKGQNGTLEMLGIKQKTPCSMKNPISILFHSCSKGYCVSFVHTGIYRSILITTHHKENINHRNRSFLRGQRVLHT